MKTESGKEKRMVQELDLLKKHQKISVKELAAALGVSEMTVRRDLELLRKNHVLERSYGYAALVEGGNGYSYEGENYDLRRARLENFAEKDRIAKYAASLIRPDDWVFLDNGTTVSRMTFYLPTDFEYTVLCYNFLILAELLKHSNIKVIFPGGYYHPEDYNFTSPEAVEFIRRHRANKAFLSVSGVHQSLGILGPEHHSGGFQQVRAGKGQPLCGHPGYGSGHHRYQPSCRVEKDPGKCTDAAQNGLIK